MIFKLILGKGFKNSKFYFELGQEDQVQYFADIFKAGKEIEEAISIGRRNLRPNDQLW